MHVSTSWRRLRAVGGCVGLTRGRCIQPLETGEPKRHYFTIDMHDPHPSLRSLLYSGQVPSEGNIVMLVVVLRGRTLRLARDGIKTMNNARALAFAPLEQRIKTLLNRILYW